MNSSLISIVIPTFNAGQYLAKCLESILLQNDTNCEVIIIDGGSCDNTQDIINEYKDLISVFISEPDKGQGDAVTKGLLRASGGICHWHAADDIVLPRAFKSVREKFVAEPNLGLVISDGLAFDTQQVVKTGKCRWINYRTTLHHFARFQSDCAYWNSSLTKNALPLDDSQPLSVDEDFFLRLWDGHPHLWLNQPLGAFRMRPGQISGTLSKTTLQSDRHRSRKNILLNKASSVGIAAMHLLSMPEHLLRNKVLPTIQSGSSYIFRTATRDKYRQELTKCLIGFSKTTARDESLVWYERLDTLMFDGLGA